MRWIGCSAVSAAALALVVGCTSDTNDSTDSQGAPSTTAATGANSQPHPPHPTLTAPSLQPPPQKNYGRPTVAFDPCTWIPDDVIAATGFDPVSRARSGDQVAEVTFLNCDFKSKTRGLSVLSGNATWDEDIQKNSAWSQPITVNGREAMWVHDPNLARACDIHLRTKVGFVDLGTTVTLAGVAQDVAPCDGLLDIATAIEPTIGKDN
ncbi:DUF3558 domain-containing protein [Nocardia wallacei]|uniref:DUF3558 domain-containing protein n=1 Tax=Nocardia wallacei TaxID=480035 RepID=UPI00245595C2|nr:DUF3558 domain-containing protein [Nocardia wallacei]